VLNNAYFGFTSGTNYNNIQWFNEYDKIDLGKPLHLTPSRQSAR